MAVPENEAPHRPTDAVLIVVAKRPAPGQTKTRLSPPLDAEQCASLYEAMLADTVAMARSFTGARPAIAYLPAEALPYFQALAPDTELVAQEGADLGERLDNALGHFLARGAKHVAVMSSDSPTLPSAHLREAFAALEAGTDVVLGPSDDGGYYLIGMSRPHPDLLRRVRMSTRYTARDTLALATAAGLSVHILPPWFDVDDASSLARLVADLNQAHPATAPATRRLLESGDCDRRFVAGGAP